MNFEFPSIPPHQEGQETELRRSLSLGFFVSLLPTLMVDDYTCLAIYPSLAILML
jgi:hypothetical protein